MSRRERTPHPVHIFTVEVCIREDGDGEDDARAQLDARLSLGTRVTYAEKSHRLIIPGEWRETAAREQDLYPRDDHELIPGERYELVHVSDLQPGDQVYLMTRRRTVTDAPWHPEEMRPGLLRIPVSDRPGGHRTMGPPFERDHLIPRLVP